MPESVERWPFPARPVPRHTAFALRIMGRLPDECCVHSARECAAPLYADFQGERTPTPINFPRYSDRFGESCGGRFCSRQEPAIHGKWRQTRCGAALRFCVLERIHNPQAREAYMKFVLVNGRRPRPESSCVMCCEPIGESYLRELTTRL